MSPPEIFSRTARRLRRDRAEPAWARHRFLRDWMIEGLVDRLTAVTRRFDHVLDLGCFEGDLAPSSLAAARIVRMDAGYRFSYAAGGVQGDEDRLPFADASFDLVLSAGVLDGVNDLPGALTLIRRALRPDGLFLGAFVGAGSLPRLRTAMRAADGVRAAPRLHPQVDVRSAGDLLVRAGFALPVADVETLDIRYATLPALAHDLRGMAASNLLVQREPLTRAGWVKGSNAFATLAEPDGRVRETIAAVFLTGWAPAPDQPRPARRGSGSVSLAEALRPPEPPAPE